jgi:ribonuclease BN (tRNA processing enzyme)
MIIEKITDLGTYKPWEVKDDRVLADDWRILVAWYSTIKRGKKFKYTEEDVIEKGKLLLKELLKPERNWSLHEETYRGFSDEFLRICLEAVITDSLILEDLLAFRCITHIQKTTSKSDAGGAKNGMKVLKLASNGEPIGYLRITWNGKEYEINDIYRLPRKQAYDIELIVHGATALGYFDEWKDCDCEQCKIEKRKTLHRKGSCFELQINGRKYLIDCGTGNENQAKRKDIDVIFSTHAHPDHADGLAEGTSKPLVYLYSENEEVFSAYKIEAVQRVQENETVILDEHIQAIPSPVLHSVIRPAVAWIFLIEDMKVIIGPDVLEYKDKDILIKADLICLDGSSLFIKLERKRKKDDARFGHYRLLDAVKWCEKANVKQGIVVHVGHWKVTYEKAESILSKQLKDVIISYDGFSFTMRKQMSKSLVPQRTKLQILPSGKVLGRPITLDEFLSYFGKDFTIASPYIEVTGGIVNNGITTGDIDVLIFSPYRDPVVEFRILRALPIDIARRVHFLYPLLGKPKRVSFTSSVSLYELSCTVPSRFPELKEKQLLKGIERPLVEKQRVIKEKEDEAEISKKEDKIVLFRYFYPLKSIFLGYRKREHFGISGAIEAVGNRNFPWILQEKYDGARVQVHYDPKVNKIMIYSMSGKEYQDRLPEICAALKKVGKSFVIDSEITGVEVIGNKKEHLGRGKVAGYLNGKDRPNDCPFTINVFDVLFWDGKDLHKEPFSERVKLVDNFKNLGPKVNPSPYFVCHNNEELRSALEDLFNREKHLGTEGAMMKQANSDYPLDGETREWIKAKIEFDIDAEVIYATKVKGADAYNYYCIIRDREGKPYPIGVTFNVRFEDYKGNSIRIPEGGIIRVVFTSLSRWYDEKLGLIHYRWWAPRPIEYREDKEEPDDVEFADYLVEASLGEVGRAEFPKEFLELFKERGWIKKAIELLPFRKQRISGKDLAKKILEAKTVREAEVLLSSIEKNFSQEEAMEILLEFPKGFFVIEDHFRGETLHGDLRRKMDGSLEGFTLIYQIEGQPGKDIETVEDAHKWQDSAPIEKLRKFFPGMEDHIVVIGKATQPRIWLSICSHAFPPGSVGATRFEEGVFTLFEVGMSWDGIRKPYFIEIFLDGKVLKEERFVCRLLEVGAEWEEKPLEEFQWQGWLTQKPYIPYILSKRAEELDTIPEKGFSCLPPWIEEKIPSGLRYWEVDSEKERKKLLSQIRNNIREILSLSKEFEKRAQLDNELIDDFYVTIEKQKGVRRARFVLRSHFWKGPTVIRGMPVIHWDLVIGESENKLLEYNLTGNPLMHEQVNAFRKFCDDPPGPGKKVKDWLFFEGIIPSEKIKDRLIEAEIVRRANNNYIVKYKKNSEDKEEESKECFWNFREGDKVYFDPSEHYIYTTKTDTRGAMVKEIPTYMKILDLGEVEIFSRSEAFDSFLFHGERDKMKGYWIWKAESPGSNFGILQASSFPGGELKKEERKFLEFMV